MRKKVKQLFCKHDYLFLLERMNMLPEIKVKGVCCKCGKSELFTMDEYREIMKKQNKQRELDNKQ